MYLNFALLPLLWLPLVPVLSQNITSNTTLTNVARSGCPSTCGNLTVPYPFGIGIDAGCAIGTWFDITCNQSFSPPKAFMVVYVGVNEEKNEFEVVNILESNIIVSYSLSVAFLNMTIHTVPVALEWNLGGGNCTEAKKTRFYSCQMNSICIDSMRPRKGYRCLCLDGYGGNPYLRPGCQDIDECKNATSPCADVAQCKNTLGSYECRCPPGYVGDGIINSQGCIRVPIPDSARTRFIIGFGVSIGILLLLVFCFIMYIVVKKRSEKKRKSKNFERNGGLLLKQQIASNDGEVANTKVFTAKELATATDNFNGSRILGQGGQGTVYKGMLPDGRIVAVKKSKLVDEKQLGQFINEVVILTQTMHKNVLKLLGCCLETEVPLLVYEFISNGTLFELIHHQTAEFPFTWNIRLRIAAEVAGALAYLHSASSVPIYHRDIKSSNILLDEKYVAKVSDFGTSLSIAPDQTHLTTMVKGTFGYLDPEYFQSSQFTEKSDVYSFGVVLVELLTGQKPISSDVADEIEKSLVARFILAMEENRLDKILDAQVAEQGINQEIISAAQLAYRCLNMNGRNRPNMKQVAMELESIRMPASSTTPMQHQDEIMLSGGQLTMNPEDYSTMETSPYPTSLGSSSSEFYPLRFDSA